MPRRHSRRTSHRPVGQLTFESTEQGSDGGWTVIAIPSGAARKPYRCPGCDHEIRPGTAHVVAWPADDRNGVEDRRHWHTPCWKHRTRRRPGTKKT